MIPATPAGLATLTGVVFVWYLNGIALAGSDFIIQIDPSWEIVPQR